jgi:two-component system CheB/CheR fusion protein
MDSSGRLAWVSRNWRAYTGQSLDEAVRLGWPGCLHPDDHDRARDAFEDAIAAGRPFQLELRLRGLDQAYHAFRIEAELAVRRDESSHWSGSAVNIESIRLDHERQRVLLSELQHRVKNILAVIRSISARSVATSTSLAQFAAHYPGRLDALFRTQGVLARRSADGVELENLIRDELAAAAAGDDDRLDISGPTILLKDRVVEVFALAIHELATNAVKYGALSGPEGKVIVSWRVYASGAVNRLGLEWRERGVKALNPAPAHVGFGRDLIERGLPYDLGAKTRLEFSPGGLQCIIDMPTSARVIAFDNINSPGLNVIPIS